jgi:hypothetical protein
VHIGLIRTCDRFNAFQMVRWVKYVSLSQSSTAHHHLPKSDLLPLKDAQDNSPEAIRPTAVDEPGHLPACLERMSWRFTA